MTLIRFNLVFWISRYEIDRFQLTIAQIAAYDLIKFFFNFQRWGLLKSGVESAITCKNRVHIEVIRVH